MNVKIERPKAYLPPALRNLQINHTDEARIIVLFKFLKCWAGIDSGAKNAFNLLCLSYCPVNFIFKCRVLLSFMLAFTIYRWVQN
jgi:hypothetical protein